MTGVRTADHLMVADTMICALAAEIRHDDFVGVGLGTPLALAAVLLARATHAPESHVLAGGAFDADVSLAGYLAGSKGMLGHTAGFISHFQSMDMAERQTMTLQFLRPAQVDGHGRLNTSRIGPIETPSYRFPGGLATADVPGLLPRIVAYVPDHQPRNLPDRVSYATAGAGARVRGEFATAGVTSIVTDLACIEVRGDVAHLRSLSAWTTVDEVRERTGFELAVEAEPRVTAAPTGAQSQALKGLDPSGLRSLEIKRRTESRTT